MFRYLVLSVLIVSVWAFSFDKMSQCGRVMKPGGLTCCKKLYDFFGDKKNIDECMKLPMEPPSCEAHICVGKRGGFGSDDGKVNREVLSEKMEKSLANDQELFTKIKENCIDGDLDLYGPSEFCELVKMKACIDVTAIKDCPEWDSKDECSGAEEAAKECIKSFN